MDEKSRYLGALMGLAVGDAMGVPLEFQKPGKFKPVSDIQGGGPFGLRKGQWTDDTSMALCLAESLIECREFDPDDLMERYIRWYREGYMSSTGTFFDIGSTVRHALEQYEKTGEAISGSTDPERAGNGSLMRLAPVALFYALDPGEAMERAGESSLVTHGARTAVDGCRYFCGLMVAALQGVAKEIFLSKGYAPVPGYWRKNPLAPEIGEVAGGSFKFRKPPEIRGSGYVVRSLEAALWAFYHSASFSEGCCKAVNLGEDADTTGAIFGQLAGAYYGIEGIPSEWRDQIAKPDLILGMAERLYEVRRLNG
ncbi:MAG TPA: ADP-ribosylglycohydrolase family protein [Thermoanaerobaculia bacterium]|nr:ADP-ribosylglycohydrolase family protein [Thermoanaerobaculia bacterium]HUM31231.1 ADP-ribosylglycohydrolase family protein [Thermoanaerobaculia bacterium]HXK69585.1 ADP-ribosylglycohydrolase family protein [Thermoanaerobaculia bacterium]